VRRLERPAAPSCLATDTEDRARVHRARYTDCRYPSGALKPLWNDLDKDEAGVSAPRRALLEMTDGECAYCGLLVGNDHMQVDHILPKEHFRHVMYAWENLLPACSACNRRKFTFTPESLRDKRVVEACLRETVEHDLVFDKPHLFREISREDRLVDPSFDDPAEHLDLVMDIPTYRPTTPIGEHTYARLFRHREIAERLGRVRAAARVVVELELPEDALSSMAIASSHPSLFRRFAEHWRTLKREGLLVAWEAAEEAVPSGGPHATSAKRR
jgi:uncharacterized protein (TIGR02646 family)